MLPSLVFCVDAGTVNPGPHTLIAKCFTEPSVFMTFLLPLLSFLLPWLLLGSTLYCFILFTCLKVVWLLHHSLGPANLPQRLHLDQLLPPFPTKSCIFAHSPLLWGRFQNPLEVRSLFHLWCMMDFNLYWGCFYCFLPKVHSSSLSPDSSVMKRYSLRDRDHVLFISALPLPAQRRWSLRICESISELINEYKQSTLCQDICLI